MPFQKEVVHFLHFDEEGKPVVVEVLLKSVQPGRWRGCPAVMLPARACRASATSLCVWNCHVVASCRRWAGGWRAHCSQPSWRGVWCDCWRNLCWLRKQLANFLFSTAPQDTAALSIAIFREFSLVCSVCRKWTNAWQMVLMNSCSSWVSVPLWCSSSHRTPDSSSSPLFQGWLGLSEQGPVYFCTVFCNKRTALQLENIRLEYSIFFTLGKEQRGQWCSCCAVHCCALIPGNKCIKSEHIHTGLHQLQAETEGMLFLLAYIGFK